MNEINIQNDFHTITAEPNVQIIDELENTGEVRGFSKLDSINQIPHGHGVHS